MLSFVLPQNIIPLSIIGCNVEMVDDIVWPKSDIGQVVQLPCLSCEGVFHSGQNANASRACVGNSSQGGQWMAVNYSQCDMVAVLLCRIALVCNSILQHNMMIAFLAMTLNVTL